MPQAVAGWRELEKELRSRLRGRRLVVEIGLTAQLQQDVEAALDRLIRSDVTPAQVAHKAPALLAVCLVAHGVYRYEQGNYWDGFPIRSIDSSYGPAFEQALAALKLEMFTEMVEQDNAARFVARILAHGGIPKYCLADYFDLLQRGLRGGAHDAADLITLWRSRRAAFAGVDKPVRRFMLYGRAISRDYLDRSIDLYREWATSGSFPSPEAAGLPVSVITELRRLTERGIVDRPEKTRRQRSSVRPVLSCDPWDALGPTVVLPTVPGISPAAAWTVATDSGLHRERATSATAKVVPVGPSREWEVTLTDGGFTIASTVFEGLDEVPALFFSPRSGALLAPGLGLTAEDLWVLRPADKALLATSGDDAEAPARVLEVLPEPTGDWSGFVLEHIDLTACRSISVGSGTDQRSISLRSSERPTLHGSLLPPTVTGDGRPVRDACPYLEVPPGDVAWQVRVTVEGVVHNAEVPPGGHFDLSPLLPVDRAAAVSVSARGVLGSDLREQFTWIPDLSVEAPDRLALPRDPAPSVHISSPAVGLIGKDGPSATFQPPGGADSVEVFVQGVGEPVLLQVHVPVLRWGLVASRRVQLGADVLPLSTLDFLEGTPPALAVSTGRPGTRLELTLEADGLQLQASEPATASGPRGQFRYDLARLVDTVRGIDSAAALVLHVGDARLPVRIANITPQFEFNDLSASALHTDDETLVIVTFTERVHARGRVLRLWPLHRPWDEPMTAALPDDARGEAQLTLDSVPPLGEYLAELTIDDGFSAPVRPGLSSSAVATFQLGVDDEIQRDLLARAESDPVAVVESILAHGRATRTLEAEELTAATVPALIAWAQLSSLPDPRWQEQRASDSLVELLSTAPTALARAVDQLAEDDTLGQEELLGLTVRLAPLLDRTGAAALRSTWRLEPALGCLLDLSPDPSIGGDATAEFLGWAPSDGVANIEEAGDDARIGQQWLGLDYETLETIRTMLQFEVRPRPLSEDGRIAATFEWLKANARDSCRAVEHWRSAHHQILNRPLPTSAAIRRHLDARTPAPGAAAWGNFGRLTLAAALHVCGNTGHEAAGQRALLEAARFAPQQVRRDLVLAWVLTNELLRDHDPDDLPTELMK